MKRTLTVAVVSTGGPHDLGASLVRGFRKGGHQAHVIPAPTVRPSKLAGLALTLRGKTARALVTGTKRLLAEVNATSPSLIIIMKAPLIAPATVAQLRTAAPTVCWNADSPFDSALSNSGGLVHEALPSYDAYVTWSASLSRAISELRDRVYVIPFGVDPELHQPTPGSGAAKDRIVIIGTASPERVRLVARLAHLKPMVFGAGWPNSVVKAHRPIFGADFAAIAGEAAWCLNPLRPQNRDSHNMRTFELLACHANQLTMDTSDHRRFLAGSRMALVETLDAMIARASDAPPTGASGVDVSQHLYQRRCEELLRKLADDSLLDRSFAPANP
jgi:spore maturation protein CgeB